MSDGPSSDDDTLIRIALAGDARALAALFDRHRDRLGRMIRLRLDPRLKGRLDPDDVLQDAYLDIAAGLKNYPGPEAMPPFLWLRLTTRQRLTRSHRHHLGAAMRSAGREVAIHRGGGGGGGAGVGVGTLDSDSMSIQLVADLTTASRAVDRAEGGRLVREAVDALDPIDREVIALRSFEGLTNDETAAVLGLSKAAASNRYTRALTRLEAALRRVPGLADDSTGPGPA